jgi:hypothetical protein
MPFKPLAALFALATAVTACGGGSDSAGPSTTAVTTPSDVSRAALLPLRTSDLPSGFAAVDVRSVSATPMVNQCVTPLLLANATQIGETFVRDDDQISSQSYVLANSAAARDVLTTLADSAAQSCLLTLLQTRFDSTRATLGLTDVPTSTTVGGLDPVTAHYRVVAVRESGGTTQTVATADLLLSQSDRSVTAVWLSWVDGSPDEATEKSIVTALRARATAAFQT